MSKVNISARPEAVGSRAHCRLLYRLTFLSHTSTTSINISDKSTADRARLGERGVCTLQGREQNN